MDSSVTTPKQDKEEICIHVIQGLEEDNVGNEGEFRFDIVPFRRTFFRYSLHGQSEVVRSTSFVYASHHSSSSAWLDIRKLSVALVGISEIPNLTLFSPTVKEIYFMGHIAYPSTAFHLLPQLANLEKVAFNVGFGGYSNQFYETPEEFVRATPILPRVSNLEIKINHQLYRNCTETHRQTFNRILVSVMKHSFESFPNLKSIEVDVPNTSLILDRAINLLENEYLRERFEIITTEEKVQINRKDNRSPSLPFDPCARYPTFSEYNFLRRIDENGFSP